MQYENEDEIFDEVYRYIYILVCKTTMAFKHARSN